MRSDNLQIIIEILAALESQLDNEPGNLNWRTFSPETLGVSVERWARLMTMLEEEKLVKGFSFTVEKGRIINNSHDARITLKGLRYLKEEG